MWKTKTICDDAALCPSIFDITNRLAVYSSWPCMASTCWNDNNVI